MCYLEIGTLSEYHTDKRHCLRDVRQNVLFSTGSTDFRIEHATWLLNELLLRIGDHQESVSNVDYPCTDTIKKFITFLCPFEAYCSLTLSLTNILGINYIML